MAALQGIPQEIYEAAELDGANGIRRFFIGIYGVQQQTADIKCAFFRFHMPSSYVKSPE